MTRLDLAVLEARWWKKGNETVRGLFDTLAGNHTGNPFGYHYEMYTNASSFKDVIARVAEARGIRNVHIAGHGDESGIHGPSDDRISLTKIRNSLREACDIEQCRLDGVFFGSCLLGSVQVARRLLLWNDLHRHSQLQWIAGFTEEVNWMRSATVEVFFWHEFYCNSGMALPKRLRRVVNRMTSFMPGAVRELGFDIFVRKPRSRNEVVSLINTSGAIEA